jgi:hypothetical protein
MPSSPVSTHHVSRSARGWKTLDANGRTVARFTGRLAHRRAARLARQLDAI